MKIADITDEAIARSYRNADPDWLRIAFTEGIQLALDQDEFTTDDLWERMEEHHPKVTTHEHRAMGSVIRKLKADNAIRPTTYYRPSRRASRHGAPIRVWRSML